MDAEFSINCPRCGALSRVHGRGHTGRVVYCRFCGVKVPLHRTRNGIIIAISLAIAIAILFVLLRQEAKETQPKIQGTGQGGE